MGFEVVADLTRAQLPFCCSSGALLCLLTVNYYVAVRYELPFLNFIMYIPSATPRKANTVSLSRELLHSEGRCRVLGTRRLGAT